jgi:4-hydroxybenzoate polyprenyltransferase
MKKIFDFLLFGNFVVSFGCFFLVYSTAIQLNLSNTFCYAALTFFSTLFIYNFQRIFYTKEIAENNSSERRRWVVENQKTTKTLSVLSFAGAMVMLFFVGFKTVLFLIPLFILSLAYFLPSVKLRKYGFFKIFILCFVWTGTTAIIPLLRSNPHIETTHFMHIVSRFCFMLAICLPFDLRDIIIDKASNIKTLPQRIGLKQTKLLAFFFNCAYIVLNYFLYHNAVIELKLFVGLCIVFIITAILISITNGKEKEYHYVGLLDGLMILEGLLMLIFQ